MNNKISVVLPVYKREQNIAKAMDSVLHQTYSNIELIVVVDQSEDRTEEIVLDYANRFDQVVAIVNEVHLGPGKSRNLGCERATGEYLFFIDADDFIRVDTLAHLIEHIGEESFNCAFFELVNEANLDAMDHVYVVPDEAVYEQKFLKKIRQTNYFHPLGVLFKKEFITRLEQPFSEKGIAFTGGKIIHKMLVSGRIPYYEGAKYYKVSSKKNVTNPSRTQESLIRNRVDYCRMMEELLRISVDTPVLAKDYRTKVSNYYHKNILSLQVSEIEQEEALFKELLSIVNRLLPEIVVADDKWVQKLTDTVKRQKVSDFLKVRAKVEKNKWRKQLREAMFKKKDPLKRNQALYKLYLRYLPKKKKLVYIESFYGENYTDSPAALYEYLYAQFPGDFEYVWLVNEGVDVPGPAKTVQRNSFAYYLAMSRASYWVNNTRTSLSLDKVGDVTYLQFWHGTPLKKLFLDIPVLYGEGMSSEKAVVRCSSRWDYLVSPNPFYTKHMRTAFGYEGEVLEVGYPRNDKLYTMNNPEDIARLKQELSIPVDKKVLLYAPTWREDQVKTDGKYAFDFSLDLEKMRASLSDDYVVLLRLHYHVRESLQLDPMDTMFKDVSGYGDISYLYLISDVLMTDYSSVMFDYAHLKRPMIFFMYDAEDYFGRLRGSYIENIDDVLPGPIVNTNDELIEALRDVEINTPKYQEKYDAFLDEFCQLGHGDSAKAVAEKVFKK